MSDEDDDKPTPAGTVRVDRWLFAARVWKSRSLATEACRGGHVRVNQVPADASKTVRVGDRVEAKTEAGPKVLIVKAITHKRGPAAAARLLYEDLSPPPPPRMGRPIVEAAPDRRGRREARRLKEGFYRPGWQDND